MIKKDKKCIGPVVATVLLIVIAVVAIVGFSTWFNSYKDNVLTNVEVQSKEAMENNLNIENVISNTLYIKNGIADNLTLSSIKIGNEICNTSVNLTLGMNEIDVSSCLSNLTGSVQDVVLISPKRIVAKTLYINSLAGGGGSCSVIDADNDGLVDWLDDNDASPNSVCSADNSGYCFINESTKSALDTDLTASNIKTSTTIFGTTGTVTAAPSPPYIAITSSVTPENAKLDSTCVNAFGSGWRIYHKGENFNWAMISQTNFVLPDSSYMVFVQKNDGSNYGTSGYQYQCQLYTYNGYSYSCFNSYDMGAYNANARVLCIYP